MKTSDMQEDRLKAHYIEQLHKLKYYDTEEKSLFQLTSILSRIRSIERFNQINHDSSESKWF
ncbi:MAG TPA: hypothetical protein VK042_01895 [Atopostipes sp.]|nr:hypothetical protein [Atopostipes sp.]